MLGCLKSPASRLFAQTFIQAQIKENIKAPRHWPLCGNSPVYYTPFDVWIRYFVYNFEGYLWKFYAKYLTHTLKEVIFIQKAAFGQHWFRLWLVTHSALNSHSHKLTLTYFQLEPTEHTSMKFESKYKNFLSKRHTWNCRLQIGSQFVKASKYYVWVFHCDVFFFFQTNTFQVVLTSDGERGFGFFLYKEINFGMPVSFDVCVFQVWAQEPTLQTQNVINM